MTTVIALREKGEDSNFFEMKGKIRGCPQQREMVCLYSQNWYDRVMIKMAVEIVSCLPISKKIYDLLCEQ